MEQSPSREADIFSTTIQIPHTLWKPQVHYLVHEGPPLVPD